MIRFQDAKVRKNNEITKEATEVINIYIKKLTAVFCKNSDGQSNVSML